MEPDGILGLATSHHDRQVKGSLGKIIAVRWYRMQQPSGLAVSLDTENARRWLVAGHHSHEKADLLGLRDEGETLIIDVREVKAYDEAAPYTVKEGVIEGHAVGQLLATIQALAEVFTPGEASPLARPRREVLREHLYTALLRDKDPAYILASQMSDHFSEEVRANAATWLVLKPMDAREAKKNAPNVQVDPEDLIRLTGRGDGYHRDRPSTRARRIQVRPLRTRS